LFAPPLPPPPHPMTDDQRFRIPPEEVNAALGGVKPMKAAKIRQAADASLRGVREKGEYKELLVSRKYWIRARRGCGGEERVLALRPGSRRMRALPAVDSA